MRTGRLSLLFALAALSSVGAQIRAGVSSVSITPNEPVWLAGYAGRTRPSEFPSGAIRARALAIDDGAGNRAVLVSVELLAVPRTITETVAAGIMKVLNLDRGQILINASGTHSAPFVRQLQPILAPTEAEEQRKIAAYSAWLSHSLVGLATAAFANLQPARMDVASGNAAFAVNAPLHSGADETPARESPGPVDTAVPVLRVSSIHGQTIAIVFGYACRAAVQDASSYALNGDYSGIAAAKLERDNPGSVALFLQLCDGDQSSHPRGSSEAAMRHGVTLAAEVRRLLESPMLAVTGPLRATLSEISLPFAPRTQAELETDAKSDDALRARWATRLRATSDGRGQMQSLPYLVQVIRLGKNFAIVALAGEPAASYGLKIRKLLGQENLVVACGSNDGGYFVPDATVSAFETDDTADSIFYSGFPGPFSHEAEDRILDAVTRAWKRVLR